MKKRFKILAVAALLASTSISHAVELEVTHWWTSGGEAAAVKVFADAVNASGHTWIDNAIAGSDNSLSTVISRVMGGNPMQATQLNVGRDAEDLVQAGLMTDLTEIAEKQGWKDIIRPSRLLEGCSYNGRVYCVPINIHSFQWMWINRKVYENNGLKVPENWSEFVASAPALREHGVIPLAIGGAPVDISGMAGVLQVAIGGADLQKKIFNDRNLEAAASDDMRRVFEAFAATRNLIDDGYVGRFWNNATTMVITGQAAGQIMGDWAQGEFSLAGQVAGVDYDCLPGLGVNTVLDPGSDAFFFPKPVDNDPEIIKAQLEMASLLLDKAVQVDFNLKKGSLPVRGDVDLEAANDCMKKGLEILAVPENILPNSEQIFTADTQGALQDLWMEFFSTPEMSVEEAQSRYVEIIRYAD